LKYPLFFLKLNDMKKVYIYGLFTLFAFSYKLQAQITETDSIPVFVEINPLIKKISFQLSYRPAYFMPLSGTKTYISDGRRQFFGLSFEVVMPKKYSFGIEINHQYFQQYKARETYDYDGTIISTVQIRTLTLTALTIFANKYFAEIEKPFRPYAQIGIGACKINYLTYWGYSPDERIRYRPTVAPAFGLKINLDKTNTWVIDTKIKYQYAPFAYDFISKINYLSADISLAFRWWKE
jgi:hypothetical protein